MVQGNENRGEAGIIVGVLVADHADEAEIERIVWDALSTKAWETTVKLVGENHSYYEWAQRPADFQIEGMTLAAQMAALGQPSLLSLDGAAA